MAKTYLDKVNTMPEPWDPYWGTSPEEELSPQVVDLDRNMLKLRQDLDETRRQRLIQFGENNAQETLTQEDELDLFELISSNGGKLAAAQNQWNQWKQWKR